MTTLYKWRITCAEHGDVFVWSNTEPTACNRNENDTIYGNLSVVVDVMSTNTVSIKEEDVVTQGFFKTTTVVLDAAPGNNSFDFSWPYPINVSAIFFTSKDVNEGDIIEMIPSPQTTIAALVSCSGNTITVSNGSHFKLGFYVYINGNLGGEVININGNVITMTSSLNEAPGSLVKVSRKVIDNYVIGPAGKYSIGTSKIGSSYVPANTIIRVTYNNLGEVQKKLVPQIEFLY